MLLRWAAFAAITLVEITIDAPLWAMWVILAALLTAMGAAYIEGMKDK